MYACHCKIHDVADILTMLHTTAILAGSPCLMVMLSEFVAQHLKISLYDVDLQGPNARETLLKS